MSKNLKLNLNEFSQIDFETLKEILTCIPANVFFKDTSCKYRLASRTCELIHSHETIYGKTDLDIWPDPIIAQTFYEDDLRILQTKRGSDFITKLIINEKETYWSIKKEPMFDDSGELIGIVGLVVEITQQVELQKKLEKLSITDPLTGVYNRTYYSNVLERSISVEQLPYAVIVGDTNGLKQINDLYGHAAGDEYIKKIAAILKMNLSNQMKLIRLGGDEFLILSPQTTEKKCIQLIKKLELKFLKEKVFNREISMSFGYTVIEDPLFSLTKAVKKADQLMYEQKNKYYATIINEAQ